MNFKKHIQLILLIFGLAILAGTVSVMMQQTITKEVPSIEPPVQSNSGLELILASSDFENNTPLPAALVCQPGAPIPTLTISHAPKNAKSYVIIMHNPDAAGGDKVHWLAWNIPANTKTLAHNALGEGTIQGASDFPEPGYTAPCPKSDTGTQRYIYELYALNDTLTLEPTTKRDELSAAMNGKVISKARLVGTATAPAQASQD